MPKPIYMTDEMIEDCFQDVRNSFEEAFAKAKEEAKTKKLADGKFKFDYAGIDYVWKDDDSKATVVISPKAYSKMIVLIMSSDKEVGWHGVINRDPDDDSKFILEDIFLFPQTVTGTTVDADEAKYPIWAMNLPDEVFNNMRFHGHSHVNMGTTPSGVDMKYREDLISQFKDGFYVFLIINKKLDFTAQIYDFDQNTLYDTKDIRLIVGEDVGGEIMAQNKEMVSEYKSTYASTSKTPIERGSGYYNYGDDYWRK